MAVQGLRGSNMTHEHMEVARGDRGNVITIATPDLVAFFSTHSRPAAR